MVQKLEKYEKFTINRSLIFVLFIINLHLIFLFGRQLVFTFQPIILTDHIE